MATDPAELPAEGLVERVRAVTPLIASTSFEAEAQRRPLDGVIEALKATGVFRSFVPARYGGYEIDMSTYVDIGLAVSHADPSMGWVTTFYMEHNWLLTLFAEELQDEIFGAQPFVLAPGTVNPSGRAVPIGRRHVHAVGTLAVRHRHLPRGLGAAERQGRRRRDRRGPAVPRHGRRCGRQGHVARRRHGRDGQPRRRGQRRDRARPSGVAHAAATSARPAGRPVPRSHPDPAVPVAHRRDPGRRCRDAGARAVRGRSSSTGCSSARDEPRTTGCRPRFVSRTCSVEVDFAETLLRDIASRMQAHADGAIDLDLPAQQQLRLAIAHVVRRCRDAIREILASSGASVHYLDHELQRLHRDIHMISAHTVFDVDLVAEGVGRAIVAAREATSGPS